MKNFFPLKFIVLIYSLFFLVPLFFILWLPNNFGWIILKILFSLWMLLTFYEASHRYSNITLGAFLCFIGVFFVLRYYFYQFPLDYIFAGFFIVWFWGKFKQIDNIHNMANLTPMSQEDNNQNLSEDQKDTIVRDLEWQERITLDNAIEAIDKVLADRKL